MEVDDINTPPAQDCPKNMVNILNDDCIQAILLKLDDVEDFLSAAKVCTRFQHNAKLCFPFKRIQLANRKYLYEKDIRYRIEPYSAESYIDLFGSRITSIDCLPIYCNPSEFSETFQKNLDLISNHCVKSLTKLRIQPPKRYARIYSPLFNLQVPFQALKELELILTSCNNFDASSMLPELESLRFIGAEEGINFDWLANRFPKLKHVIFSGLKLTSELFIEFQRLNPQLLSLKVIDYKLKEKSVWENVGDRIPNIVELKTNCTRGTGIIQISTLRHLKRLNLDMCDADLMNQLFSVLIVNKQPIEELVLSCVNEELGLMLRKIETIKSLYIGGVPDRLRKTYKDFCVDIAKNQPRLESFEFPDENFSAAKKILQHCPKITKLNIMYKPLLKLDEIIINGLDEIIINGLDEIVALATGRVEVGCMNFYLLKRCSFETFYSEGRRMYDELIRKQTDWVRFFDGYERLH